MTGAGDPRVAYATIEDIRDALDVAPGTPTYRRIPRAIYAASTGIEGLLNRRFYPILDTRYKDWPLNYQYAQPWRLWLDNDEVLAVDTIVTGGQTLLPNTHFILKPENTGPPYSSIEIRLGSGAMWAAGNAGGTWQQSIQINGTFGGCDDTEPVGALTGSVNATASTVTVTDSTLVGTLDTIRVGTEWMTVTSKTMAATGATLAADITLSKGQTLITPTGGTWHPGETILIDAERLRITDVAGSNLVVDRAVDGTVLAPHTTGAVIYAPRTLNVTRGVLGSTAASHASSDPVSRLAVPELVRQLAIAETLADVEIQSMGYTSTKGDGGRYSAMREINDLRNRCYTRWARQSRIRAV